MHVITGISNADLLYLSQQILQYFSELMSSLAYNSCIICKMLSFRKNSENWTIFFPVIIQHMIVPRGLHRPQNVKILITKANICWIWFPAFFSLDGERITLFNHSHPLKWWFVWNNRQHHVLLKILTGSLCAFIGFFHQILVLKPDLLGCISSWSDGELAVGSLSALCNFMDASNNTLLLAPVFHSYLVYLFYY